LQNDEIAVKIEIHIPSKPNFGINAKPNNIAPTISQENVISIIILINLGISVILPLVYSLTICKSRKPSFFLAISVNAEANVSNPSPPH